MARSWQILWTGDPALASRLAEVSASAFRILGSYGLFLSITSLLCSARLQVLTFPSQVLRALLRGSIYCPLHGRGRLSPSSLGAQKLPKHHRALLFGCTHTELDLVGSHYQLYQRYAAVSLSHTSFGWHSTSSPFNWNGGWWWRILFWHYSPWN